MNISGLAGHVVSAAVTSLCRSVGAARTTWQRMSMLRSRNALSAETDGGQTWSLGCHLTPALEEGDDG